MLMTKERRPAFRTIEGWARLVLLEAGAIHECEEHGRYIGSVRTKALELRLILSKKEKAKGK